MSNYTIGLSGLNTTSGAIDTTSNNIANANTVGYKAGQYLFQDQFFKALNPADPARTGQGVAKESIRRPFTYGTITSSTSPLDLAIQGQGLFRLASSTDTSQIYYTRNGQFALDKSGNIVNENGMLLTGYAPTPDGQGITNLLTTLKMPPPVLPPAATTQSDIGVNLDARQNGFLSTTSPTVSFDPSQPNTYNSSTSQTVFDSTGVAHTLTLYYRRVDDTVNYPITANQVNGVTIYSYQPSPSAVPAGNGSSSVILPSGTTLSNPIANGTTTINVPVVTTTASTSSSSTSLTVSSAASLQTGMVITGPGIPTGTTITVNPSSNTITLSQAASVQASAALNFSLPPVTPTALNAAGTTTATTTLQLTPADAATVSIGQRVVDTTTPYGGGALPTVLAVNTATGVVTLDTAVTTTAGDALQFGSYAATTAATAGGNTVTVSSNANISVGQTVTDTTGGSVIPANTVVTGISGNTVTLSNNVTVASGDVLQFGSTPVSSVASAPSSSTTLTVSSSASVAVGQTVTGVGVPPGTTVTAVAGNQVTLSQAANATQGANITFSAPSVVGQAQTLTLPDGTQMTVNNVYSGTNQTNVYYTTVSNYQVYASLDGAFYGANGQPSTHPTTAPYTPITTMKFNGGKNIDAMVKDPVSGNSTFSTEVSLANTVSTQGLAQVALDFKLDLTNTENYGSAFQVNKNTQDGSSVSQLTNCSVDANGNIVGQYGNGKTQFAGQLVLANFTATEGLVPSGGNVYTESYLSGSPTLGSPNNGGFGSIRASSVEQSNVDLTNELVQLMIQQRMYQANSQSIRAFNETLKDTIQITQ